jgi:hypothetical protein
LGKLGERADLVMTQDCCTAQKQWSDLVSLCIDERVGRTLLVPILKDPQRANVASKYWKK